VFEQEFERLLFDYPDAINSHVQFCSLVRKTFSDQQKQMNLILFAYDLEIAKEIQAAARITNAFAYNFVKRLIDDYGISRANADWAISVWCICYGHHILKKSCDIRADFRKGRNNPVIKEGETETVQYGDLFEYGLSNTKIGYAVSGFRGDDKRTIIFQNTYHGQPVVEIKAGAFSQSDIEEVIMSEGLFRILEKAFYSCSKLQQVVFPTSLKELGDYAFAGCINLSTVSIPPMLEQLGAYSLSQTKIKRVQFPKTLYRVGEGALSECREISKIEIPENISEIPDRMFQGCVGLTRVELHKKLISIGDYAFSSCTELEYIFVPNSVIAIGEHSFDNVHNKFILMCSEGSFAEKYARKKKMKYQLI
jgi:hypothetical protein